MDKLINYIQFREKKYGVIKGIASVNSMYYQIGIYTIRVSEHMKYSESSIKDCDYFFIIQPNDTYIFITNPKYNKDGKMYMKIVSYNDAKEFIKSLDEFAGKFIKMTDWYHPENWNRNIKDKGKLSWDEFERIYMRNISDEKKFGFSYAELDRYIREGIVPEGTCENNPDELKVDKIDRMYRNNKFKTEIVQIPHFDPLVEVFDLEL